MQAIHPYCGDRKVLKGYNDLRTTHPEIAREWNKERNGDLKPTNVITSSNKRVWWKCKEGHEWSGLIANRARRGKADPGCPYCSGRKVLAGFNDLAATHPGIAAMWHPRMNRRVFGNGFLDILAARFRQSGKRTADVSDFCLPEHQGLVHPLARAVELDESSMVDHPVDHRGGKLVVAQDRSPFAELDVGGEHHASLLVAC